MLKATISIVLFLSSALLIACHSGKQPLTIFYTVENTANVPVVLPPIGTPFSFLHFTIIEVLHNGTPLPYHGGHVSFAWHLLPQYCYFLQPGEKVEKVIDLSRHFNFLQSGEYEVILTPQWQKHVQEKYLLERKPFMSEEEDFLLDSERTISASVSLAPSLGNSKKLGENVQLSHFAMLEPVRFTIQVDEDFVIRKLNFSKDL